MLLTIFLALNAVGIVAWILGTVFQFQGMAAIGGVIIVGAGVMVVGTGLEYRSGQQLDHDYTLNDSTGEPEVRDNTTVVYNYQEASLPSQYSVGFLVVLFGSLGLFRALDEEVM